MSNPTLLRRWFLGGFVLLMLALLAPRAAQAQQRIGFVNPQRVVNETRIGQMAKSDLARYVAEKDRAVRESAAQLAALKRDADVLGVAAAERARREEAYRRKAFQHETLVQENARDIKAEEAKLLQYVMPELNRRAGKKIRKELYGQRARESFAEWLSGVGLAGALPHGE